MNCRENSHWAGTQLLCRCPSVFQRAASASYRYRCAAEYSDCAHQFGRNLRGARHPRCHDPQWLSDWWE